MLRLVPLKIILPVMLMGALSLLTGILTGWYRLGISLPLSNVFIHHGAIMTGSFLGTLILMERIVPLRRKWLFVFPAINVSSILFYFLDLPEVAFSCLVIGALGLMMVFFLINRKQSDLPHQLMWGASAAWLIGNVFLLKFDGYAHSILWWMAFLLITISAERLELNRFLPVSPVLRNLFLAFLLLFVAGCLVPFHYPGRHLAGASLVLAGLWLLRYDMIRKSIKKPGIHRYTAVILMFGYGWLVISGGLFLLEGTGNIPYDALMHSFFIGFVFSMIMAHAPIILPGVLGLKENPFHPALYLWGILLQATLMVRIAGGLNGSLLVKQAGGVLNGVVILGFLLNMGLIILLRKRPAADR